jgi:hypothetical protein
MNAVWHPTAYEVMAMPSMSWCGSRSMSSRSLNVPGSPSSALHTTYTGFPVSLGMNDHFSPVGNPAPPRPRSPDALISSMTSAGFIFTAFRRALYPPAFT